MAQYCRYCVNLTYGDVPYCDARKQVRSEEACKRANKCKDFQLCDAEPEFQDAFRENLKGYQPRKEYAMVYPLGEFTQMQIEELERQADMFLDYAEKKKRKGGERW